jgi:hypothetical protein
MATAVGNRVHLPVGASLPSRSSMEQEVFKGFPNGDRPAERA